VRDRFVHLLNETLRWRVVALIVAIGQLMHFIVKINAALFFLLLHRTTHRVDFFRANLSINRDVGWLAFNETGGLNFIRRGRSIDSRWCILNPG
jgi:hypothetical protein